MSLPYHYSALVTTSDEFPPLESSSASPFGLGETRIAAPLKLHDTHPPSYRFRLKKNCSYISHTTHKTTSNNTQTHQTASHLQKEAGEQPRKREIAYFAKRKAPKRVMLVISAPCLNSKASQILRLSLLPSPVLVDGRPWQFTGENLGPAIHQQLGHFWTHEAVWRRSMERVPLVPFVYQGTAGGAAIRIQQVGLYRRGSFAFGRGGVIKPALRVLTHISECLWGKPDGRHVQIFEAAFLEVEPHDGDLCRVAARDFFEPIHTFSERQKMENEMHT